MSRIEAVLGLLNASSSETATSIDPEAFRFLLAALKAEAVAVLALAGLAALAFILLVRQKERRAGTRGAAEEGPAAIGKLKDEIAGMVRRTNERNNYINSIFSSLEDGLLLVDGRDQVVLVTPRAQSLLCLGPEIFFEGIGRSRPPEVEAILAVCARVTRTKSPERLDLASSSGRILEVRVVTITNKYSNQADFGSLAIVNDVTEMRKMEAMKKDFVASVSHEFRTPLTLISGFMEMFRTQPGMEPEDRARALEIVDIETERLKRLVSELLMLSEIENSLPREAEAPIDVEAVIRQIALSLGELALAKGQRLELRMEAGGRILEGNENWFYEAIKNLVENAIKYTQAGGTIMIVARIEGESLLIEVSDNGIGIDPSEFERIFERFYRIDASRGSGGGGSGLGLSLVKDIASFFGGSVKVESMPGSGSTFTLSLPIADRREHA